MDSAYDIDFLQPSTVWVQKRCYRVLLPGASFATEKENYIEDEAYPDNAYDDEECTLDFNIPFEQLPNGKFRTSFPVASSYFPYLIGAKGATKQRIENDTYTQIKIPAKGQIGDIVITGKDVKTVRQARIKLELLVDQAKRRQPFTHFVSIPLNNENIQNNFFKFKKDVLERCSSERGVDASIFQNPSKLHITICVLVLADERERQEAMKVLQDCQTSFINYAGGDPIKVELKGVEYMNDDPSEVDVLYAKVEAAAWADPLQEIADEVVAKFVKAGLATKTYERVKLHVTMMNTLFRDDKDGADVTNGKNFTNRETFDARKILQDFKDFYFGELELSEIHLSIRHTTSNNGYYSHTGKICLDTL